MAKIGLNNFRYGILTEAEDGTATYGKPKKPGKAVSCNVDPENNDASLYADDGLAESDKSFNKAAVKMGIDEDDQETMADLLGHKVDAEKKEMVRNSNDVAPYVGLGRIVTKMVNGKYKYKVEFLHKVKFAEPSQEDNTKGENTEFATTKIDGTASQLANGDWSKTATFDTKTEAVTYLEGLFTNNSGL